MEGRRLDPPNLSASPRSCSQSKIKIRRGRRRDHYRRYSRAGRTDKPCAFQGDRNWSVGHPDRFRILTRTSLGIIMSLHLHRAPHPSTSTATELRILMGFEAGSVECWAFRPTHGKPHSIEGIGWERLWNVRFHAESGLYLFLFLTPYPTTTCGDE